MLSAPGASLRVWNEHERIFGAMVDGDADAAARLMRDHMETAAAQSAQAGEETDEGGGE